MILFRC